MTPTYHSDYESPHSGLQALAPLFQSIRYSDFALAEPCQHHLPNPPRASPSDSSGLNSKPLWGHPWGTKA